MVHCEATIERSIAAGILRRARFRNSVDLADGFDAWKTAGLGYTIPGGLERKMTARFPSHKDLLWQMFAPVTQAVEDYYSNTLREAKATLIGEKTVSRTAASPASSSQLLRRSFPTTLGIHQALPNRL